MEMAQMSSQDLEILVTWQQVVIWGWSCITCPCLKVASVVRCERPHSFPPDWCILLVFQFTLSLVLVLRSWCNLFFHGSLGSTKDVTPYRAIQHGLSDQNCSQHHWLERVKVIPTSRTKLKDVMPCLTPKMKTIWFSLKLCKKQISGPWVKDKLW